VKTMMKNTEDNQNALLAIIDQLFVFIKDPQDANKKLIAINPKLDNKLLSKLITDSRVGILKLYTTCEEDFFKGLQIFESLVWKQIMDTSTAQIKKLQENVEQTVSIEPNKGEIDPIVEKALENSEAPVPIRLGDAAAAADPVADPVAAPADPVAPAAPAPTAAPALAAPALAAPAVDPIGPKLDEPVTPDPKPLT